MGRTMGGLIAALVLATAGDAAAGAATFRGVVLAEDGTPAAGASVWLVRDQGIGPPERRQGVADAEGRYAFEVEGGPWALGARFEDQEPRFLLSYLRSYRPAPIRLWRHGLLRARIVEAETGRPIAGARLALDNGLRLAADAAGRLETRGLDREGVFINILRGEQITAGHHEASAEAPGRESRLVLFAMGDGPTTDLEVALPRGGRAVGRVLDEAGRPVAGATVGPDDWGGSELVAGHLVVPTDEDGRFEFAGLPLDRASSLVAAAPGHLPDSRRVDPRPGPDDKPAEVDFRLARRPGPEAPIGLGANPAPPPPAGRDVTGLVVGGDRRPVAATVVFDEPRGRPQAETRTDAAGRFRLAGVPDQDAIVQVIPDRPDLAPEIAAVAAGGDEDLLIVTPPGRTATGVVHDDRGVPFAGVRIVPRVGEGNVRLATRAAVTDARGRFAITGLPDLPTYLDCSGPGMARMPAVEARLDAENDVIMAALGTVGGRVVAADGRPVRTFRVLVAPPGPELAEAHEYPSRYGDLGLTFTADDGTFRVRNLLPNSVARVTILAPGHAAATVEPVAAVPGNRFDPAAAPVFRLGPPRP